MQSLKVAKIVKTMLTVIIQYNVVLYLGIMKVWEFLPQNITPKQLNIYFGTPRQDWLGIAKPKNVFRSTINLPTKLI